MLDIVRCETNREYEIARSIVADYVRWLNIDLAYQGIESELRNLRHMYGPPGGCFIIGCLDGKPIGGVAFRAHAPEICEMKRLYIYPEYHGNGYGKILCTHIMRIACKFGYKRMRLDTLDRLGSANRLYEAIGFQPIPQYIANPFEGARFWEIGLTGICSRKEQSNYKPSQNKILV